MSCKSAIVEVLSLAVTTGSVPVAVQVRERLQESLAAWRQMHGVSHQSMEAARA
jgi:hypothetical protein